MTDDDVINNLTSLCLSIRDLDLIGYEPVLAPAKITDSESLHYLYREYLHLETAGQSPRITIDDTGKFILMRPSEPLISWWILPREGDG